MTALERYQRAFLEQLYAERAEAGSFASAAGASADARFHRGLDVHRRNLVFTICRAMSESYPLCRDLLGEANFRFLCREYLRRHPSRSFDLGEYGAAFPELLAEREEVRDFPFLADLARLEWVSERASRLRSGGVLSLRTRFTVFEAWSGYQRSGIDGVRAETIRAGEERLQIWSEAGRARVAREPVEPALRAP